MPEKGVSVVPANEASWDDLQAVVGIPDAAQASYSSALLCTGAVSARAIQSATIEANCSGTSSQAK